METPQTISIEETHRKHLAVMRGFLHGRNYFRAAEALEFALAYYEGTRKDKRTPKFHHPLTIVKFLATLEPHLMFPEETLAAGFLHDVVEDNDGVEVSDIVARFGPVTGEAVRLLTKKHRGITVPYEVYFGDMAKNPIASIVKCVDRINNVQTMVGVFSGEKQREYAEEVETWFLPMAKKARRNFPRQYGAYENVSTVLRGQVELIGHILNGTK
jgi:GTP pyrophosphokinase